MRATHSTERVGLDPTSPWWAEHRSRYVEAAKHVRGKLVADVACGSGLGLDLLLDGGASHVIAIDFSPEAISIARGRSLDRVTFVRADALALPLAGASIDVVVSFETIEHLHDADLFLNELARVSRPHGTLILSTPNRLLTAGGPDGDPANPFHVQEFTPEELAGKLRRRWERVELFGQGISPSFGVCPFWESRAERSRRPAKVRRFLWKIFIRLPRSIGARVAAWLLRQPLYPSELDFMFDVDQPSEERIIFGIASDPRAPG